MKIKKIKLLKALAMTGAFGIIATVPVIVSSCSSTSDNNGGNGDTNQGGEQSQTIIPQIKSSVTLSGALTDIYNPTDISKTNSLIADEIKNNLADVFDNGSDLTNVSDLEVSVTHTFPASTWTGLSFDSTSGNWKAEGSSGNDVTIDNANKLVYSSESQLNISSLSDLKTQLDDTKLKEILTDAKVTPAANTVYSVANSLGFTNKALGSDNRDLLHVNVVGTTTTTGANPTTTTTNYDLQIPVSDLNLVISNLSVTVKGTNVTETTLETNFTYNIGINSASNYEEPTNKPSITQAQSQTLDANVILEKLGYVTASSGTPTTYTVNNDTIVKALGVYNVTFTNTGATVTEKTDANNAANQKTYTITLNATPNDGHVWEDATNTSKPITFDAILGITTA